MSAEDETEYNPYIQMRPERQPPRLPMTEMDAIDWSAFEDAYGPATAVPQLIRGLTSSDPEDRAWAIEGLDACIHHQGSVYDASTVAVPFLVALSGDREVDNRELILKLLAGIAVHVPDECIINGAFQYRSEAYDAVRDGGPTFLRLLSDPDAAVSTAAAYVLCYLEPPPDGTLEALCNGLESAPDPLTRGAIAMALGYASRYLKSTNERGRLGKLLADSSEIVRLGAGVGLVQMDGMEAGIDAKLTLQECYGCKPLEAPEHFWPWLDGDVARLSRIIRESVITNDELLARMKDETQPEAERSRAARTCVYRLLRSDRDRLHEMVLPEDLSQTQLELLTWVADNTEKGGYDYEFFERQGLPDSLAQLSRFLGREVGGSDRSLEMGDRRLPAWFAIREVLADRLDRDQLVEAAKALGPEAVVDLVDDALGGPWLLNQMRGGTPYGDPEAMEAFDRHIDRFIELMADILREASDVGLDWARRTAADQVALGEKRKATSSLVAAIALGRDALQHGEVLDETFDALLALDQVPASTHLGALQTAYQLVPSERRERLLADRPLFAYTRFEDPDGVIFRWKNADGWTFLPLLSAAESASRVADAWVEWDRHLGGNGSYEQHVSGGVTSSLKQRPAPDEPFPTEQALSVLSQSGEHAVVALERALGTVSPERRELIAAALNKVRSG